MSATSTTDLEPLSDHGAAARVRHLREHLPLDWSDSENRHSLILDFFLILHRETRKTITFKMVLAGLKSVNEKYPNSNLKSSHLRLLSFGDDDCASPPCDSPGRYGRYGYPGEDTDMDTIRGRS